MAMRAATISPGTGTDRVYAAGFSLCLDIRTGGRDSFEGSVRAGASTYDFSRSFIWRPMNDAAPLGLIR
jgi:hypothetical protein